MIITTPCLLPHQHRPGVSHQTRHAQGTFTELRKGRVRLVGAVLTEQNDEWIEARRYMGPEILAACKKGRNTTEKTRMAWQQRLLVLE